MRSLGVLIYEQVQAIDVAGPLDVFTAANDLARARGGAYALHTIGLDPQPVRAENGMSIVPAFTLSDAPELDTLLIPGGAGSRVWCMDATLLAWIRARAASTRRVASVCTGLYLLAATGLLDGRSATTHWRFADDTARRHPRLRVEADRLFLRDGPFYSSGGLTAGIDLALALVEQDLGAATSLSVARELVMYMRRPGNQAQFSAPLQAQTRGGDRFAGLVDWMVAHLSSDIPVDRMAEQVAMSPRNFRRQFRESFDCTPARFLEQLRLERACVLLTSGHDGLDRIAAQVGFASPDALRRSFRHRYGLSPGEYRQRFGQSEELAGKV